MSDIYKERERKRGRRVEVRARRGEGRYPIGVWRHLADDAYNGGNERNPGISRALAASNGHAQQRDNSICRAIMRVSTPSQTQRGAAAAAVLSYFVLVFPSRDQSGYVAVLADRGSDNNYLFDALRYARYPAKLLFRSLLFLSTCRYPLRRVFAFFSFTRH